MRMPSEQKSNRSIRRVIVIGMLALILPLGFLYAQRRDRMRILFENEGREVIVSTVWKDDVQYASLEEFSDAFRLRHFYNPQNEKVVLRAGARSITATAMNPFLMVDGTAYQMALPAIDVNGDMYIPLRLFLDCVGAFFPGEFEFDRDGRVLRVIRFRVNITGVEVEEKLNGSLIRFITTKNFQTSDIATSVNREWLNVTIYGGLLDSVQIASDQRVGKVVRIVPFQFEKSAQISFQIDGQVADKNVYIDEGEVVVSIRSPETLSTLPAVDFPSNRRRWLIDKIIIDPGHGGKDPGAVGDSGLLEKEINLDIAQRLKTLLEKRLNVEVLLTRNDDRQIRLKERTQFANTNDGKLFISIHANWNNSRRVRGYSTYVLGTEKNAQALAVAEKENSVIELEESAEAYREYQDAAHIINAIAQSSYLKESQDLAGIVNEELNKATKLPQFGNGIYQAPFYVLIGAAMPRILIETAFLSNKYEERQLRTRSFRQKVAEAICESIERFKEKYEEGIG